MSQHIVLRAQDVNNGRCTYVTYMKGNQTIDMPGMTKFAATYSASTTDINTAGSLSTQTKQTGQSVAITMTCYTGSNAINDKVNNSLNKGADPYFDLQLLTDDPSTTIGRQIIVYHDCICTSAGSGTADVDNAALTTDYSINCPYYTIEEDFKVPTQSFPNNIFNV